jgi:menaquinol-cytochrome c reductase cytochrome b/c subunit
MSEPPDPKFAAQFDSDARRTPVRVAFVTRRTSPQVKAQDESVVMTFPEGLFRAAVAIEFLAIALAVISLIWDAPLEQLADPMHTPNPAKAPWYFLGLQELLHYFPPFVAGVLIPTLVVLALIVIPYFNINIESEGVWLRNRERRLRILIGVLVVFTAVMLVFHVYAVLIPTLLIAAFMLLAAVAAPAPSRFRRWLVSKPLSFWIMTWFLVQASILTVIGTFFRGAGWSWVWPWRG